MFKVQAKIEVGSNGQILEEKPVEHEDHDHYEEYYEPNEIKDGTTTIQDELEGSATETTTELYDEYTTKSEYHDNYASHYSEEEPDQSKATEDNIEELLVTMPTTTNKDIQTPKEPANLLGYYKHPSDCDHKTVGSCLYVAMWFRDPGADDIRFVILVHGAKETYLGFSANKTLPGSDIVMIQDDLVPRDGHINM